MMKYMGPILLLCILSSGSNAYAQTPCPTAASNGKLACVIPNLYGSGGFSAAGVFGNTNHEGHYDVGIDKTFSPLNSDISRQVSLLPIATPGSGFSLIFDPSLKTFVTTTDSLGPILGDRAETIGRHRVAIGVNYQHFDFDKIDGVNLSNFPAVFTHADDNSGDDKNSSANVICSSVLPNSSNNITPDQSLFSHDTSTNNDTDCAWVRDRIDTSNQIHIKVHLITSQITFGLTKNIDVSVVVPYEIIRFSVVSNAHISLGSNRVEHYFNFQNTDPAIGCNISNGPQDGQALNSGCFNHQFLGPGSGQGTSSASGIGDLTVRLKSTIWRGERAGFAAGLDVRFPTGDSLNFLGSGTYGVKPFVIASYRARVAPHALVGFQANGSSVTSGDLSTGVKGQLPNELVYNAGADAYATKWLSGAFDIVGERVLNAPTLAVTSIPYLGACYANPHSGSSPNPYNQPSSYQSLNSPPTTCLVTVSGQGFAGATYSGPTPPIPLVQDSTINATNASYNITNASAGVRIALIHRLVLTLNVLVRLDNGGLHSKLSPMGGLGYTF